MKKLIGLCKYALIVVVLGMVLLVIGILKEILALTIVGGCFIGLYVVLVTAVYLYALFDSVKRKNEKNGGSGKAAEAEMLEEINTSAGINNEAAVHARQAATVTTAMRRMGTADRLTAAFLILVIIFGVSAVAALIATGYRLAAICTACGIILFVGGFIIIIQRVAKSRLHGGIADESSPIVLGRIESCVMYTETTFTSGNNNAYQSSQRTRVLSTVYKLRVRISVSDGNEDLAKSIAREKVVSVFSRNCYDCGDEVKIARRKGSKRSYVVLE